MASYVEIYVAHHTEQGRLKRRETVTEFRRTIRVPSLDVARDMYDRVVDMVQIELESREVTEQTFDESASSEVPEMRGGAR